MKTLKQFQNEAHKIWRVQSKFYRLGIDVKLNGEVGYNWYKAPHILEEVSSLDWIEELSFEEKLALALAVNQEEANGYLDDSEIREVNSFFGVNIDQDLISKIGGRFI